MKKYLIALLAVITMSCVFSIFGTKNTNVNVRCRLYVVQDINKTCYEDTIIRNVDFKESDSIFKSIIGNRYEGYNIITLRETVFKDVYTKRTRIEDITPNVSK